MIIRRLCAVYALVVLGLFLSSCQNATKSESTVLAEPTGTLGVEFVLAELSTQYPQLIANTCHATPFNQPGFGEHDIDTGALDAAAVEFFSNGELSHSDYQVLCAIVGDVPQVRITEGKNTYVYDDITRSFTLESPTEIGEVLPTATPTAWPSFENPTADWEFQAREVLESMSDQDAINAYALLLRLFDDPATFVVDPTSVDFVIADVIAHENNIFGSEKMLVVTVGSESSVQPGTVYLWVNDSGLTDGLLTLTPSPSKAGEAAHQIVFREADLLLHQGDHVNTAVEIDAAGNEIWILDPTSLKWVQSVNSEYYAERDATSGITTLFQIGDAAYSKIGEGNSSIPWPTEASNMMVISVEGKGLFLVNDLGLAANVLTEDNDVLQWQALPYAALLARSEQRVAISLPQESGFVSAPFFTISVSPELAMVSTVPPDDNEIRQRSVYTFHDIITNSLPPQICARDPLASGYGLVDRPANPQIHVLLVPQIGNEELFVARWGFGQSNLWVGIFIDPASDSLLIVAGVSQAFLNSPTPEILTQINSVILSLVTTLFADQQNLFEQLTFLGQFDSPGEFTYNELDSLAQNRLRSLIADAYSGGYQQRRQAIYWLTLATEEQYSPELVISTTKVEAGKIVRR